MKIRELLTDESKWTKGVLARNKNKNLEINPSSPDAVCWCLVGAVYRCYEINTMTRSIVLEKLSSESITRGYHCISDFNDNWKTRFEDVKQLVEKLDV